MPVIDFTLNKVYSCFLTPIRETNDDFAYIADISKDKDLKKVHQAIKTILTKDEISEHESQTIDGSLVYRETPEYIFMSKYDDDVMKRKNDKRIIRKIVHFRNPITNEHVIFEQTKRAELTNYYKIHKAIKNTDTVPGNDALGIARNVFWESLQNTTGTSKTVVRSFDDQEYANYIVNEAVNSNIWIYLDVEPRKIPLAKKERKLTYTE